VKYACIRQYEAEYPIKLMCRVLRVTRSGYYAWRVRPASERQQRDTQLRVAIRAIYRAKKRRYGSPRIHLELREQHQLYCSRKRVARLMQEDRLRARRAPRRRWVAARPDPLPLAPNLLRRRFRVAEPNVVWASDVTACPTGHGWLFLAVVLDLASRRVIGWAAGRSPGQELTVPALRMALEHRQPAPGLMHHSDRGMHYSGSVYRRLLADHHVTVSMSRRGNCWDNAVLESFFATLKAELLDDVAWENHAEGIAALRAYIDWYNRHRRHSTLGYLSPITFEQQLAA
jgi:transposase InsO family protein